MSIFKEGILVNKVAFLETCVFQSVLNWRSIILGKRDIYRDKFTARTDLQVTETKKVVWPNIRLIKHHFSFKLDLYNSLFVVTLKFGGLL